MRKVIYGGACSLDGFITGGDGALDWLHFSKDVEAVMAKFWANTDALLFGRKTWEQAAGAGGGGGSSTGIRATCSRARSRSRPAKASSSSRPTPADSSARSSSGPARTSS